MKYKQLRNKALTDATRLITAIDTRNSEKWFTPDGYFATTFDIYEGYKVKKEHQIPDQNPKMESILESLTKTPTKATKSAPDENGHVVISFGEARETVNSLYLELLEVLHDKPTLYIDTERRYAPVQLYKGKKMMALLMPLKV